MNNQTTELLQQLAVKLGTTSQYLWSVLLHQAPIDATITLIQIIIFLIPIPILIKLHFKLSKDEEVQVTPDYTSRSYKQSLYDKSDAYGPLMCVAAGISLALLIVSIISIGDVINGYFNPEYWALDHILSVFKKD